MSHLSPEIQQRFLARGLSANDMLRASKHLVECELCRSTLVAQRSNRPDSLIESILQEEALASEHPSIDLIAAYVDGDVEPKERQTLEEHLSHCERCRESVSDLKAFRTELLQMHPAHFAPLEAATQENRLMPAGWFRRFQWRPHLFFGGALVAAILVVFALLFSGRFSSREPSEMTTVEIIQDKSVAFEIKSQGHVTASAGFPPELLNTLKNALAELPESSGPTTELTRGLSTDSAGTPHDASDAKKRPSNEDSFDRNIFGQVTLLPRATSDPHARPNGVVVPDLQPVLTWRPLSTNSTSLTAIIEDCDTSKVVVKSEPLKNISAFSIPTPLQRGNIYRWRVTAQDQPGAIIRLVASGRFKISSAIDPRALGSSQQHESYLLNAVLLAQAGLFQDSESELVQLQRSNPGSQTIRSVLAYVRQLEGR
jgi:predicted anti-sigma-YlaC factor YlaD